MVVLGFLALSLIANAGPFGGKGGSSALKKIVTILVAMQAKQALMQTDLGKELFENIQQTQNADVVRKLQEEKAAIEHERNVFQRMEKKKESGANVLDRKW